MDHRHTLHMHATIFYFYAQQYFTLIVANRLKDYGVAIERPQNELRAYFPDEKLYYGVINRGDNLTIQYLRLISRVLYQVKAHSCLQTRPVTIGNGTETALRFRSNPPLVIYYWHLRTCFATSLPNFLHIFVNEQACGKSEQVLDVILNALGARRPQSRDEKVYNLMGHNIRNSPTKAKACQSTRFPDINLLKDDIFPLTAIKNLKRIYCPNSCKSGPVCQNGGVNNVRNCSQCICPLGLTGPTCEITFKDGSGCDGEYVLTENVSIPVSAGKIGLVPFVIPQQCSWLFTAPIGRHVKLRLLKGALSYDCSRACLCRDFLDVRAGDDLSAKEYQFCCSKPLEKNTIVSKSNKMLIVSRITSRNSMGFMGTVKLADVGEEGGMYE